MVTVTVLNTLLLATLPLTPHLPRPLFAVWVWALYGCICASFILLPTATAQAKRVFNTDSLKSEMRMFATPSVTARGTAPRTTG